jgi:hypothetical protein
MLLLVACAPEPLEGPFALAFDGAEDCVEVDVADLEVPAALTVDVWLRGDPASADRLRPFVNWTGLFTLDEDRDGHAVFTVGDGPGTSTVDSVMDGVLHHLAGTWDGATVSLYVDGVRQAFADGAPTEAASSTLRLGCDGAANAYEGLLDEVRLSSTVRYGDDFARPTGPFDLDDDAIALFHLDEGVDDRTFDEANGLIGQVEGPEWVSFSLSADE